MQTWLGIEWDDVNRGRHNGSVQNHTYFTTTNNLNSGTLLKIEKVNLGITIIEGIFQKYFKDNISAELK